MEYTGERMVPESNREDDVYVHHVARYYFAAQFVKDRVVLDIACGSGYGSKILLDSGAKKVVGVDISEEAIDYCKANHLDAGLEFERGSVEDIPIPDASVDVVVSFETIEHVDGIAQEKFLHEVRRILRKDGIFVVSTPNTAISPKGNPFHLKELSLEELNSLLSTTFSSIRMFYQDNIETSYVLSESQLRIPRYSPDGTTEFRKIGSIDANDNLFFVAVCRNTEMDDAMTGLMCLSNVRPWKRYVSFEDRLHKTILEHAATDIGILKKDLEKKDALIAQKDALIAQKDAMIRLMKASKFWKARGCYLQLKSKAVNFLKG